MSLLNLARWVAQREAEGWRERAGWGGWSGPGRGSPLVVPQAEGASVPGLAVSPQQPLLSSGRLGALDRLSQSPLLERVPHVLLVPRSQETSRPGERAEDLPRGFTGKVVLGDRRAPEEPSLGAELPCPRRFPRRGRCAKPSGCRQLGAASSLAGEVHESMCFDCKCGRKTALRRCWLLPDASWMGFRET